jgi:hypothetical protein
VTSPVKAPKHVGMSPKLTLSAGSVLWRLPPPSPVIVNENGPPVAAFSLAEMVRTASPEGRTLDGLKAPLTPAGSPLTLSSTGSWNPFTALRLTVKLLIWPGLTACVLGETTRLKSSSAARTAVRGPASADSRRDQRHSGDVVRPAAL